MVNGHHDHFHHHHLQQSTVVPSPSPTSSSSIASYLPLDPLTQVHHPQAEMGHGCHTCISNTKYATHNFAPNAKYRKRAQQDCAKVNFKPTLCTAGQGIQITKACFRHGGKAPPICLQASSECKRCKRGQCVQIGLDLYSWFLVLWPLKPSQQSSRFKITNLYQLYFIC